MRNVSPSAVAVSDYSEQYNSYHRHFQKSCRGGQGIETVPFSDGSGGHGVSGGQFLQLNLLGAREVRGETWRETTGFLEMCGIIIGVARCYKDLLLGS